MEGARQFYRIQLGVARPGFAGDVALVSLAPGDQVNADYDRRGICHDGDFQAVDRMRPHILLDRFFAEDGRQGCNHYWTWFKGAFAVGDADEELPAYLFCVSSGLHG